MFSNISSSVHQFPLTNQQLINQLVINLLFAGLQISHLGIGGLIDSCVLDPWTINLPSTWRVLVILGGPGEIMKFSVISSYFQDT